MTRWKVLTDGGTQWRMSLDPADNLTVTALDEKVTVTADDAVTVYE